MLERLTKLVGKARKTAIAKGANSDVERNMLFAEYLLANGVIVPPCKVGDTAYRISTKINTKVKYIQETTISRVAIDDDEIWLFCACNPIARCIFGKTVFLTKEEAEAALKGGKE